MNNDELNKKLNELETAKGYFDYAYSNLIDFINKELKYKDDKKGEII